MIQDGLMCLAHLEVMAAEVHPRTLRWGTRCTLECTIQQKHSIAGAMIMLVMRTLTLPHRCRARLCLFVCLETSACIYHVD